MSYRKMFYTPAIILSVVTSIFPHFIPMMEGPIASACHLDIRMTVTTFDTITTALIQSWIPMLERTMTDASSNYLFDGPNDNQIEMTVTPTVKSGDERLPNGAVRGLVFSDRNGDETQDDGPGLPEEGLSGVIITLLTPDGTVVETTTTDADGNYEFPIVAHGSYVVREMDPTGFTSTTNNQVAIFVPTDDVGIANFGDQQSGTVGGVVFDDINGNGDTDSGENGFPNVTAELVDLDGNVVDTATTDENGNYEFPNVEPGPYTVVIIDPSITTTSPGTVSISIPQGGSTSVNVGGIPIGQVRGVVFNDKNGDGDQDPNEDGLNNVTIELVNANYNAIDITTTSTDGSYAFPSVEPGAYRVRETNPAGFSDTTKNTVPVSVPPGGSGFVNFGDQQAGTVSGVVFNDPNGDGNQQPNENGLSEVTIELVDPTRTVVAMLTTEPDGSYLFTNVTPGPYTVRETDPLGFTSTSSNQIPILIATNGASTANFGDQLIGTVSGVVFNDSNGNGVEDRNEGGFGSVSIRLVNANGNEVATSSTACDGSYLFSSVSPGAYTVHATDPTGYHSTTNNTVPISVLPNSAAIANFGDQQRGSISGVVFNDTDEDSQPDMNESGISGVAIELVDEDGNVVRLNQKNNYTRTREWRGGIRTNHFSKPGKRWKRCSKRSISF
ncbi:carboxypeptidase regulatory-like domain-containing protein [Chloroflexi bacterium TSY]|nr:carboxypeptidase regulatory-like domain-containing protein [Chloroflexi bacterium TSY]